MYNRQDFPNFNPDKQIAAAKTTSDQANIEISKKPTLMQSISTTKKPQDSVVIIKGKKKGKSRIDEDPNFKQAIKNSLNPNVALEEENPNQKTLVEKIQEKVVDQNDFIEDDEEYEKILQKIMKESEQEAKIQQRFQQEENVFYEPLGQAYDEDALEEDEGY